MLYKMLADTAKRHARSEALCFEGRVMTFADLVAAADRFAARLAAEDIGAGDRVALLLPNTVDFVVSVFAVAKVRGILVPLNRDYPEGELRYYFGDARPAALVTTPEHAEHAAEIANRAGLEPRVFTSTEGAPAAVEEGEREPFSGDVLYQYSSGSTGMPKRVMRTQANLVAEADNFVATVEMSAGDRILTVVPLFHAHGFGNCLLASARSGAAMVLLEGFHRGRVLRALSEEGVTVFPGVPFMFGILAASPLQRKIEFPALRLAFSAGAALPREAFEGFGAKFGVTVRQLYGSTEVGSASIHLGPCSGDLWASVGLPMRNVEIRIAAGDGSPVAAGETGEILVRSAAMTAGYHGLPEINAASFRDGFFCSGDLGHRDAEGRIFITGRNKLLINVGGFKVDPLEVEAILNSHPSVAESVVVGVKANHGRELVKAVVVRRRDCSAAEIQDWCRGKLADFKIPQAVQFRSEIPKSPLGKILRKYLTEGDAFAGGDADADGN
jgi:long-chain acyl-CoA synthetase